MHKTCHSFFAGAGRLATPARIHWIGNLNIRCSSLRGRAMKRLKLPGAAAIQTGLVKAWTEPVVIPTYHPLPPDKNPMFLEKRVYQGSSGRVYPLPFTDRISTDAAEHTWQAVHLENEFLRVMVLPEIGGRIHVGIDKTNGYDFFYPQNVIKPPLVALPRPSISRG